jgi:flavorubredoxin
VKAPFQTELKENIEELSSLEKIDYVIVNHVEMDHSGALPYIMERAKNVTIISTQTGKDGVIKYYGGEGWNFRTVKTGDELKLGNKTLQFVEAPMLHWPDSMFTYLKEDELLMPNDAFGEHFATSQRFADEADQAVLMDEVAKYYANILMPLASVIIGKISEVSQLGVKPKIIAPSHGVIWRSNPERIVNAYLEWSKGATEKKAVIVYDTMWGSTEKMAYAISEALKERGVTTQFCHIRKTDLAEIVKEILDAKAVIMGSPTINNSVFPTISGFLSHILGLRPKGKIWAVFGSYGWGGGAVRDIERQLKESGFEVLEPSISVKFAPNREELQKCRELGERIAERIQ